MASEPTTPTSTTWINPLSWSYFPRRSSLFGGGGGTTNHKTTRRSVLDQMLCDNDTCLSLMFDDATTDNTTTNSSATALADALEERTTLTHVRVCCPTFFGTRRRYSNDSRHDLRRLFGVLGSRPQLASVVWRGHEDADAVPVEFVADFLEGAAHPSNHNNHDGLQEFSCHHVAFVTLQPTDWSRLGNALDKCRSLQRVCLANMSLTVNNSDAGISQEDQSHYYYLDLIVSRLRHCTEVELGLRYRGLVVSGGALRQLLSLGSNLQKLTLRRRLAIHDDQLCAILQSLCRPSSALKELQIDEIRWTTTTTVLWKELAEMLQYNTSLECLELSFLPVNTVDVTMNQRDVEVLTRALKHNTTLKRLALRGIRYTRQHNNNIIYMEMGDIHECPMREIETYWLNLLEHDNYTLEELHVLQQQDNSEDTEDALHDRIEFFLRLNRQQVVLPKLAAVAIENESEAGFRTKASDASPPSCGLRTLLRNHNGAIPHHLVVPCLEAAMEIQDLHHQYSEDSFFQDFALGGDDLANIISDYDMETFAPSQNQRGTGGLFYLLSQQPSIVMLFQERLEAQEAQPR